MAALRGADEIAMAAWREAIVRMSESLSPDVRAAFDTVWPDGPLSAEGARVLIDALQRALDRKNRPAPGSITYLDPGHWSDANRATGW